MYQLPKCQYSYLSKALECFLRVIFPCKFLSLLKISISSAYRLDTFYKYNFYNFYKHIKAMKALKTQDVLTKASTQGPKIEKEHYTVFTGFYLIFSSISWEK